MNTQRELFQKKPEEPPAPDEIVLCTKCGRSIVIQGHGKPGYVSSEFRNEKGECFKCDRVKK